MWEEREERDKATNRTRYEKNSHNNHNQGGKRQTETRTLRPDEITSMVARGEMTQEEAEERFEEIGRRFQEKLTREAILDMMESGHLTMEESEVELRELESRERKNNRTPIRKSPKEKWKKHAKIVLSMGKGNMRRVKQTAHGGNEGTAPKHNKDKRAIQIPKEGRSLATTAGMTRRGRSITVEGQQ